MGVSKAIVAQGERILSYIPQRPPIVMVDKFYGIEGESSFSGLTIKEDNIFIEEGLLSEAGIVEHIAQSAALRMGYFFISQNQPVPLGFIGSVSKCEFLRYPSTSEELFTTIVIENEVFGITLIKAKVEIGDEVIAECKMKISLQN